MKCLLDSVQKHDVKTDPFPHIVIRDPLDQSLCEQLIDEFPAISTITASQPFTSNERYSYPAQDVFENPKISDLWKQFIQIQASGYFLKQFSRLFEKPLLTHYPNFERRFNPISSLKPGIRKINNFSEADVLLDAQICINAPVTESPKPIKPPHIDRSKVLFAGLYYLRHPEDSSSGGDLEIYRFKSKKPYGFRGQFIDKKYVELVNTIKYEKNVLVLFLNSIYSLHGVTVRSRTSSPRCFVNLVGEVNQPLFDRHPYEEKESNIWRVSNTLKKVFT